MTRRVQDEKPPRTRAAAAWVTEEIAAQKKRHHAIQKEMNEGLARQRERWYADFLGIVGTKGFNANGDMRVKIPKNLIPKKPKRKDVVVY